jgi:hypothetical protein
VLQLLLFLVVQVVLVVVLVEPADLLAVPVEQPELVYPMVTQLLPLGFVLAVAAQEVIRVQAAQEEILLPQVV